MGHKKSVFPHFICSLFLLFGLFETAQAQWYTRQYGADRPEQLTNEQLNQAISQAKRMHDAGRYIVFGSLIAGGANTLNHLAYGAVLRLNLNH